MLICAMRKSYTLMFAASICRVVGRVMRKYGIIKKYGILTPKGVRKAVLHFFNISLVHDYITRVLSSTAK